MPAVLSSPTQQCETLSRRFFVGWARQETHGHTQESVRRELGRDGERQIDGEGLGDIQTVCAKRTREIDREGLGDIH